MGRALSLAASAVLNAEAVTGHVATVVRPVATDLAGAPRREISHLLDVLVPTVTGSVLRRMDLTELVLRNLDVERVVAGLDLEAILSRVDLVKLSETVIAGVDLPEIVRDSTGSMASSTLRGVRLQGISADAALAHTVGRLRQRRRRAVER